MQDGKPNIIIFDTETTGVWNKGTQMICPYSTSWVENKTKDLLEQRYGAKEPNRYQDFEAWQDWDMFRGENILELKEEAVDLYLMKYAGLTRDDLVPDPAHPDDPWRSRALFRNAEVLTLSIIDTEGNVLLDEMYKPIYAEAWPGAEKVNGISPEMVADKPPILADKRRIEDIFNRADVLIGYNGLFDLKALRNSGLTISYHKALVDVMRDFAKVWGEYRPNMQYPTWKKLTFAAEKMGLEWDGQAHGSLADAKMTLAVHNTLAAGWTRDQAVPDVAEQAALDIDHAMATKTVEAPTGNLNQQVAEPQRSQTAI